LVPGVATTPILEFEPTTERAMRAVLEQLEADGVSTVFALPGGPLMPVYEELFARAGSLRTVLVRQEGGAIFAADGYARASGRMAACAVTAGPGTTNMISALAVAYRDMVPLFAIAATPPLQAMGKGAAQELDTVALLERVTKETALLLVPERAGEITRRLLRSALSGRPGPVVLCVPADIGGRPIPYERAWPPRSYRCAARPVDSAAVGSAVETLATASQPAMLVGSGVNLSDATPAAVAVAETLRCPVASTPRGKGAFPETHPLSVGPFGFAGSPLADRVIRDEADVLLVLGSRLGELSSANWTPRLARKRIIQVDLVAEELGRNFPIEVGVVGDARAALEGIAAGLAEKGFSREHMPLLDAARWLAEPRATTPASAPFDPCWVFERLRERLPADAHVFCDIGNSMCWAVRQLVRERSGRFHVNLTYGCMGHSVPAAVGAVMSGASPVVSLVGDSSFMMTGSEVAVAVNARLPGPTWIVLDNGGNGMCHVGFELGCDGRAPSSLFERPADIVMLAHSLGAGALTVDAPGDLDDAVREAIVARRPTVLRVPIDPDAVPPMGGRLEALTFAKSGAGEARR
jgi:acetolactate synthase-1/2/3 large subunit